MALDIYQQVLVKLYEETGGKDNRTANLMDIVKKIGLFGSYASIFNRLSDAGWIAESPKPNFVGITLWGVKEARKALEGGASAEEVRKNIVRQANQAANSARELVELLENAIKNPEEGFDAPKNKFIELETSFSRLKNALNQ